MGLSLGVCLDRNRWNIFALSQKQKSINTKSDNHLSQKSLYTSSIRGNLVRTYTYPIQNDFIIHTEKELGKGGVGVVYVGERRDNHEYFAIKYVNKVAYEREVARLERELKLLKDVDHANIIRVFSVYDQPKQIHFVMELCSGGHLGNLLSRQPQKLLPEDWARKLFTQLISAVSHIHSKGICHRDIKLQNILLDHKDEKTAQLKLIDFGYGARYRGNLPMRTKCGTPYTTAPEVFRESYDERCDVWSCGVVLYIMLSGRRPFEMLEVEGGLKEAGRAAMIANILACRYHMDHATFQSVSQSAKTFIQKLLEPNYTERMNSLQALEYPWVMSNNMENYEYDIALRNISTSSKGYRAIMNMTTVSNNLRNLSMIPLAFSLPQSHTAELRRLFQSFDRDSSGCLSREEWIKAMTILSPDLTFDDINHLFDIVDIDSDGVISYTEFLAATIDPRGIDMAELNEAFRLMDVGNKGYITVEDIAKMLEVDYNEISAIQKEAAVNLNLNLNRSLSKSWNPSASKKTSILSPTSRGSFLKTVGNERRSNNSSSRQFNIDLQLTAGSVMKIPSGSTSYRATMLLQSPGKAAASAAASLGFSMKYNNIEGDNNVNKSNGSKPASRRVSHAININDDYGNNIIAFRNDEVDELADMNPKDAMERRIHEMMELFDLDHDGVISIDEFLWVMTGANSLFGAEISKRFTASKRLPSKSINLYGNSLRSRLHSTTSTSNSSANTSSKSLLNSKHNQNALVGTSLVPLSTLLEPLPQSPRNFESLPSSPSPKMVKRDDVTSVKNVLPVENTIDAAQTKSPEAIAAMDPSPRKTQEAAPIQSLRISSKSASRSSLSAVDRPDEYNFATASLPMYKKSPVTSPQISPAHVETLELNTVQSNTVDKFLFQPSSSSTSSSISKLEKISKIHPSTIQEVPNESSKSNSILKNLSGMFSSSVQNSAKRDNSSKISHSMNGIVSGRYSHQNSVLAEISNQSKNLSKHVVVQSTVTQAIEDCSELSPNGNRLWSSTSNFASSSRDMNSTSVINNSYSQDYKMTASHSIGVLTKNSVPFSTSGQLKDDTSMDELLTLVTATQSARGNNGLMLSSVDSSRKSIGHTYQSSRRYSDSLGHKMMSPNLANHSSINSTPINNGQSAISRTAMNIINE